MVLLGHKGLLVAKVRQVAQLALRVAVVQALQVAEVQLAIEALLGRVGLTVVKVFKG